LEVIHAPHQPIVHVYFPQDGVVSLVMVMADGTTAIRDRPDLEAIACECYGIISREYTRLLG
jgi:hypothetical protein